MEWNGMGRVLTIQESVQTHGVERGENRGAEVAGRREAKKGVVVSSCRRLVVLSNANSSWRTGVRWPLSEHKQQLEQVAVCNVQQRRQPMKSALRRTLDCKLAVSSFLHSRCGGLLSRRSCVCISA